MRLANRALPVDILPYIGISEFPAEPASKIRGLIEIVL